MNTEVTGRDVLTVHHLVDHHDRLSVDWEGERGTVSNILQFGDSDYNGGHLVLVSNLSDAMETVAIVIRQNEQIASSRVFPFAREGAVDAILSLLGQIRTGEKLIDSDPTFSREFPYIEDSGYSSDAETGIRSALKETLSFL